MPPKKKKGGKKKGGDEDEGPTSHPAADRLVMQFDASAAKAQISRLEDHNTELMGRVSTTKKKLQQTKADQADVYVYLHKKLDDNFDVIAGLEAKILDLEADKDRLEGTMQRELAAAKRQAEEEQSELQSEINVLQESLLALQEFKAHKESIEASMVRLQSDLAQEKKAHEDEVAELERRNVAAKDKLKKEMFMKIKETKKNILSSTEDQLQDTTKRTMAENSQMSTELQYQSKETEKLIALNAKLSEENAELRREQSLSEQTQQELVKRTHFYQRLIKKLNERIKVAEEREREANETVSKTEAALATRDELDRANEELDLQDRQLRELQAMLDATRTEADEREGEYQRWVALQDEATKFLLIAIDDVKKHAASLSASRRGVRGSYGQPAGPPRLDELGPDGREHALNLLLAKMQLFQTTVAHHEALVKQQAAVAESQLQSAVSLPPIGPEGSGLSGAVASTLSADEYGMHSAHVGVGTASLESMGAPLMTSLEVPSHVTNAYSVPSTLPAEGSVLMIGAVPPKPPTSTIGVQTVLTGARPPLPADLGGSSSKKEEESKHQAAGRRKPIKSDGSPRAPERTAGEPTPHFFSAYDNVNGIRRAGGSKYRASTLRSRSSTAATAPKLRSRPVSIGGDGHGDVSVGALGDSRTEEPHAPASRARPGVRPTPQSHTQAPLQSGVGFSTELSSLGGRAARAPEAGAQLGVIGVQTNGPSSKKKHKRSSRKHRPAGEPRAVAPAS